jgi:hypothetical protein
MNVGTKMAEIIANPREISNIHVKQGQCNGKFTGIDPYLSNFGTTTERDSHRVAENHQTADWDDGYTDQNETRAMSIRGAHHRQEKQHCFGKSEKHLIGPSRDAPIRREA